jgi:serine/threonine-protein kinase
VFEGTSAYHLIARHLNDPPPAPSTVTTSTIPGELDAIILACLRKRPSERPASAIALSESLASLAA